VDRKKSEYDRRSDPLMLRDGSEDEMSDVITVTSRHDAMVMSASTDYLEEWSVGDRFRTHIKTGCNFKVKEKSGA
jgi:hypothetical protein